MPRHLLTPFSDILATYLPLLLLWTPLYPEVLEVDTPTFIKFCFADASRRFSILLFKIFLSIWSIIFGIYPWCIQNTIWCAFHFVPSTDILKYPSLQTYPATSPVRAFGLVVQVRIRLPVSGQYLRYLSNLGLFREFEVWCIKELSPFNRFFIVG